MDDFSELGDPDSTLRPTRTTRSRAAAVSKVSSLTAALRNALRQTQQKLTDALQKNQKQRSETRQLKTALNATTKDSELSRSQLSSALDELRLAQDSYSYAARRSSTSRKQLERCREDLKVTQRHVSRLKGAKATLKATVKGLRLKITDLGRTACSARTQLEETASLRTQASELTVKLASVTTENEDLKRQLTLATEKADYMRIKLVEANLKIIQMTLSGNNLTVSLDKCEASRRTVSAKYDKAIELKESYKKRLQRAQMSVLRAKRQSAILRGRESAATGFKIYEKGVITAEARTLIRSLSAAGCPHRNIGKLVKKTLKILAPKSKAAKEKEISARTVGRAVGEGGVASQIQLGYELLHTESQYILFLQNTHYILPPPQALRSVGTEPQSRTRTKRRSTTI